MMSCASGNSRRLSIKFMCVTLPYMSICAGVVVAVTFEQIDCTPDTETGTESDNESLKNTNSRVKKFHSFHIAKRKSANAQTTDFDVRHSFQKFYLI